MQDGAPKIAKLVYKWLNYGLWYISIVNGRYNGFCGKILLQDGAPVR